jgi:hypothetical protein
MHNGANSLIDHILCNDKSSKLCSGSIVDDLSDHFLTFVQPESCPKKRNSKNTQSNVKRKLVTVENMTNLQNSLKNLHWNDVLATDNVDDCYGAFWTTFKTLYDLHIPTVTMRLNRNYHRMNSFMTSGLLVSRRTRVNLLKISLVDPSPENKLKFKLYRNMYNKLIRIAKKQKSMKN